MKKCILLSGFDYRFVLEDFYIRNANMFIVCISSVYADTCPCYCDKGNRWNFLLYHILSTSLAPWWTRWQPGEWLLSNFEQECVCVRWCDWLPGSGVDVNGAGKRSASAPQNIEESETGIRKQEGVWSEVYISILYFRLSNFLFFHFPSSVCPDFYFLPFNPIFEVNAI